MAAPTYSDKHVVFITPSCSAELFAAWVAIAERNEAMGLALSRTTAVYIVGEAANTLSLGLNPCHQALWQKCQWLPTSHPISLALATLLQPQAATAAAAAAPPPATHDRGVPTNVSQFIQVQEMGACSWTALGELVLKKAWTDAKTFLPTGVLANSGVRGPPALPPRIWILGGLPDDMPDHPAREYKSVILHTTRLNKVHTLLQRHSGGPPASGAADMTAMLVSLAQSMLNPRSG